MEQELIKKIKELYNTLIVVNSITQDNKHSREEQITTINLLTASQLSKANNIVC